MKTLKTHTQTDRPVGLLGRRFTASAASAQWRNRPAHTPAPVTKQANPDLLESAKREAEALAWTTPFPDLFLPALLQEKVDEALARAVKQTQVQERTARLWIESVGLTDQGRRSQVLAANCDRVSAAKLN